jgi:hypothetical protein
MKINAPKMNHQVKKVCTHEIEELNSEKYFTKFFKNSAVVQLYSKHCITAYVITVRRKDQNDFYESLIHHLLRSNIYYYDNEYFI